MSRTRGRKVKKSNTVRFPIPPADPGQGKGETFAEFDKRRREQKRRGQLPEHVKNLIDQAKKEDQE